MSETAAAVDIRPIQGSFGAEIIGLDLSQELPDAEFRRIEQAWFDASLLVFRDLVMTPEQHIAFTRRLRSAAHHDAAALQPSGPS